MTDPNDKDEIAAWMNELPGVVIAAYPLGDGQTAGSSFNLVGTYTPHQVGCLCALVVRATQQIVAHLGSNYDKASRRTFARAFKAEMAYGVGEPEVVASEIHPVTEET